jgi:hypothetical protein
VELKHLQAFGGGTPTITGATELWNGTSWTTSTSSLATARSYLEGAGTQAAALAFGGAELQLYSSNRRMDSISSLSPLLDPGAVVGI